MKRFWSNVALIIAGCLLFALAFDLFLEPNSISPGGFSGLALILSRLIPLAPGFLIIVMNIPFLLAGYRRIGRRFILYTLFATFLSSLLIDLFAFLPPFTEDVLLASLYGGVLMGAGLGLVFLGGATTGGTDIVMRLLRLKFPHIRAGRLMLISDFFVVTASAVTFRNYNLALYAIIAIYVSSLVIDAVVYGLDKTQVAYIVTDKHDEVVRRISDELDRGATYLKAQGTYHKDDKLVIMCAMRVQQTSELIKLVNDIDPDAFLILHEASEIVGNGFERRSEL